MDSNPLNWTAGPFLALYLILAALACAAGIALRFTIGSGAERRPRLSELEWAYLAGGPSRVGDVALLCLVSRGGAVIAAGSQKIDVSDPSPLSAMLGERIAPPFSSGMSRQGFQSALVSVVERVRARLETIGYAPSDADLVSLRLSLLPFFGTVLALGAAKAMVGAERGHPVGLLMVLLGLTLFAGFALASRPLRTRAGAAALRAHRSQNTRSARAPLERELLLAVALSGAIVLSGTEFAPIYAASRASGDGGGGDGGGGCGGGGGGGCGGCS